MRMRASSIQGALLASPADTDELDRSAGSVSDILIETSGTTGEPKSPGSAATRSSTGSLTAQVHDRRIGLNLLVHHSVGGLRLFLPLGHRTVYLNPARMMANPSVWLDCVTRFGVTDAGMSSAMAAKINEAVEQRRQRLEGVELSSASPLDLRR